VWVSPRDNWECRVSNYRERPDLPREFFPASRANTSRYVPSLRVSAPAFWWGWNSESADGGARLTARSLFVALLAGVGVAVFRAVLDTKRRRFVGALRCSSPKLDLDYIDEEFNRIVL
jgi:hypothetical protein